MPLGFIANPSRHRYIWSKRGIIIFKYSAILILISSTLAYAEPPAETGFGSTLKTNTRTAKYRTLSRQEKVKVVADLILSFKKSGIAVSKSPEHYVDLLDDMMRESPVYLTYPLGEVL